MDSFDVVVQFAFTLKNQSTQMTLVNLKQITKFLGTYIGGQVIANSTKVYQVNEYLTQGHDIL